MCVCVCVFSNVTSSRPLAVASSSSYTSGRNSNVSSLNIRDTPQNTRSSSNTGGNNNRRSNLILSRSLSLSLLLLLSLSHSLTCSLFSYFWLIISASSSYESERLAKFQNARSISSAQFFERDEREMRPSRKSSGGSVSRSFTLTLSFFHSHTLILSLSHSHILTLTLSYCLLIKN
jgi:hypothetical protein